MKVLDYSVFRNILLKNNNNIVFPYHVHWDLTYECTNACKHCYLVNISNKYKKNETKVEQALAVIDELCALGCKKVTFSGGDPFLYDGFQALIQRANMHGLIITIFSSGQFISETQAKFISDNNVFAIEMTVFGDKVIHNNFTRNKNSFDNLEASIHNLRKYDVHVVIKTTLHKDSYKLYEKLKDRYESLGCEFHAAINIFHPWEGNEDQIIDVEVTKEQMIDYYKNILRPLPSSSIEMCNAGRMVVAIRPNGDVSPCNSYYGKVFGNINDCSFKEVWCGIKADEFRNTTKCYPIKQCIECSIKEFCDLCPGVCYWGTGKDNEVYTKICRDTQIKKLLYTNK